MHRTARHILKADEVTLEGVYRLSIDRDTATKDGGMAKPAVPNVRVAQIHPDYAVIEVTCCCGRTSHIRCEYTMADTASAPQELVPS